MSITHITYAIPSVCHTAADLAEMSDSDETFIRTKVGVEKRYVLGPNETGVSLSVAACEKLFESTDVQKNDVDLLICITETPDRKIPFNAAAIASELGLGNDVASFDVALGCSGYVYGLTIAEGFLMATGMKNAILVTCDPYSRIIDPKDKATNCVFGDAASATWVQSGGETGKIIASDFGTDGSKGQAITIPGGGAENPLISVLETSDQVNDSHRLYMDGRSVFNFVNSVVPKTIENALAKAELTKDDIDYFVLHQGSSYMLDSMARRAQLPKEKVIKNIHRYGNTVSSSLPILLSELQEQGNLEGKIVLASGFGVGLSWATSVINF